MSNMQLASIMGQVAGILVLSASVMLWLKWRSPWLLVAMVAQVFSTLCRVVLLLSPGLFTQTPALQLLWPLASAAFGVGLLCHALLEIPVAGRRPAATDSSS
jgi:hypothetical protein